MISFLFIACLPLFQTIWADSLENISFSEGDRIPGSGEFCVLAYDYATDDPSEGSCESLWRVMFQSPRVRATSRR